MRKVILKVAILSQYDNCSIVVWYRFNRKNGHFKIFLNVRTSHQADKVVAQLGSKAYFYLKLILIEDDTERTTDLINHSTAGAAVARK